MVFKPGGGGVTMDLTPDGVYTLVVVSLWMCA